jgi:hypothetical protein
MLQQIYQSFCVSDISHDKYTFFALEESGHHRSTYTCSLSREFNPHRSRSPTDSHHRCRRKKDEDPYLHTTRQNHKKQKLERLRSTRLIRRDPKATNSRHAKTSSEITDSGYRILMCMLTQSTIFSIIIFD